jgi:hypothetical protein
MGCEVIKGFMFLLREKFNNGGKNCFFPTQFFPAVLDEKISRSKQWEQSKLTNCDYKAVMKDIREDILCSIIEQRIVIGDNKQKIWEILLTRIMNSAENYK